MKVLDMGRLVLIALEISWSSITIHHAIPYVRRSGFRYVNGVCAPLWNSPLWDWITGSPRWEEETGELVVNSCALNWSYAWLSYGVPLLTWAFRCRPGVKSVTGHILDSHGVRHGSVDINSRCPMVYTNMRFYFFYSYVRRLGSSR